MYIYARINKDTLRFIREKKAISFDYVTRITKFKEEKIVLLQSAVANGHWCGGKRPQGGASTASLN